MCRSVMIAVVALVLAGSARAGCLDGDYRVVGRPLLSSPGGAFTDDRVTIAGDTIAIASGCPAVVAQIRTTERGTVLRARWESCGTIAQGVRLRAFVNKTCRRMRGRLVTRRPRDARRFVAHHIIVGCDPADDATCRVCKDNADCTADQYCAKSTGTCSATGACETRPLLCTRELRPVCGCDGVTYANPCVAAAQGASIAHEGRCSDVCGGIAGVPCSDGELCELPGDECHTTDLQGECVPLPHECPTIHQPVCGCDGVTYSNDCERQRAKAQKAQDGPCVPAKCESVCDCYLTQSFPEPCPLECATCDNYWTCEEGMCVPHCGPLPPLPICKPRVCGGLAGLSCADGEFCELPKGECHTVDLPGECVPIPTACPLVHEPVCGCDGVTYGNDCERQAAKAQKAHDGPCTPAKCENVCDCYLTQTFPEPCPLDCATCDNYWTCEEGMCVPHCGPTPPLPICKPRICGGIAGMPCAEGEFCELPKGECQGADLQGECLPIPKICPDLYAPVCGCDGVTYSNQCERQTAGVQLAHDGACGEKCATTCDCEKASPLPDWCSLLMCPACGCAWVCDAGVCALEVRSPPPPSACDATAAH